MLHVNKPLSLSDTKPPEALSAAQLFDAVNSFVRRRFLLLLLVLAAAIACGFVYLFTAPPKYTAKAQMIIDTRKVQVFQQQSVLGDSGIDTATIDSQIELIKSDNVASSVVKQLHLTEMPEFVGEGSGLFGSITKWLSPVQQRSEFELTRAAISVYARGLAVRRVLNTYVIEISFQSLDPELAARVANAAADAYILDQLDAKYQATKRASSWLQDRIQELRQQASAAERDVLSFKQNNNIVDTGGRLIDEQQLTEQNSQLVQARANTAEAKARLDRILNITRQDIDRIDGVLRKPDAAVADALRNDVITKLRSQYLDLANREADFAARLGSSHQAAVNLRNQMLEIRRSIFAELQRIAETFKSDYEISQARENSVAQSLAETVQQSQTTNRAQISLRELESNAQTYRALHDNFLQRYMEAVQQQSFPITEARLISPATRPLGKSHPSAPIVLGISVTGGLFLALGAALFTELSDRGLRTVEQVERILGIDCLSILPRLKHQEVLSQPFYSSSGGDRAARTFEPEGLLSTVVDQPFSRFTEAIRTIKVAVDLCSLDKQIRAIGITSALPNEGKSTVAMNFANLIGHTGRSVVLVDCDLRNPSLSRSLSPQADAGLLEVISGTKPIEDVLWTDKRTGLAFLPLVAKSRLTHTNEALASDGMRLLIEQLRGRYDYVVVDLPPLAPVVDVRSTTQIIDSYILVVEWGRTNPEIIKQVLSSAPQIYDKLLGAILNKADMAMIKAYERYGGGSYYKQYNDRYGIT